MFQHRHSGNKEHLTGFIPTEVKEKCCNNFSELFFFFRVCDFIAKIFLKKEKVAFESTSKKPELTLVLLLLFLNAGPYIPHS